MFKGFSFVLVMVLLFSSVAMANGVTSRKAVLQDESDLPVMLICTYDNKVQLDSDLAEYNPQTDVWTIYADGGSVHTFPGPQIRIYAMAGEYKTDNGHRVFFVPSMKSTRSDVVYIPKTNGKYTINIDVDNLVMEQID